MLYKYPKQKIELRELVSRLLKDYPVHLIEVVELVDAGEPLVALENMCENIFEHDIEIGKVEGQLLLKFLDTFKASSHYYQIVNSKGGS